MIYLRQSTASQEISLGPFVDATDGNTPETGLTIANTDIKIRKAGAITLANKNSGGATHISGGVYYATLDATDTDTLGSGEIYCQVSGALYVKDKFTVLPAQVYDSMILGTDLLQVDTTQVGGTSQTAGDIIADTNDIQTRLPAALVSGRMDASVGAMAANTLTASALATDAVGEIADGVWDEPLAGHAGAGSTGEALSAAGAAGDPWITALPGSYTAGQAGYIVGTNLNGPVGDVPTASENATAVLAATVEGSVTVVQSLRLSNSALGGKASGLDTTNPVFRDLADTKDRIDATVDSFGNRTAVTRDLT